MKYRRYAVFEVTTDTVKGYVYARDLPDAINEAFKIFGDGAWRVRPSEAPANSERTARAMIDSMLADGGR